MVRFISQQRRRIVDLFLSAASRDPRRLFVYRAWRAPIQGQILKLILGYKPSFFSITIEGDRWKTIRSEESQERCIQLFKRKRMDFLST